MTRIEMIKNKYKSEGLWSAAKEVPVQSWDLVKENPRKTAGTFVAIAAVASLTAAYFLSPAYATFVGTVGTKAATLVSPAITAMSAFAVAHPLIASLVVLAAVAALITAPVLAYKNSGKSEEIKALNGNIDTIRTIVKDGDKEPDTKINELKVHPCLAVRSVS
ncbi:hypothetical protein [Wolbachia endosymbiont of Tribolium confusum]|uniref:hypothetical protein n=1 Tax=Wolbachia endosymbiont of Tribolium confusum TaxID=214474 RepID=UPI001CF5900A|nr:hypothetical protein [Wolbachia endosymbiont of Tribolium confusum]MCA7010112.1 hypothetical protein [Wolbachia endosymbiont of Tribolium confusum]